MEIDKRTGSDIPLTGLGNSGAQVTPTGLPPIEDLRKAPVHTINVKSWPAMQNIQENLEKLGLLGDQFLYCCIPLDQKSTVHNTGYYSNDEYGPMIFACHYTKVNGEMHIAQVDDELSYDLWHYINKNGNQTTAVLAIYDRAQMRQECRAAFQFIDPANPEQALKAIVVVKGLDGK